MKRRIFVSAILVIYIVAACFSAVPINAKDIAVSDSSAEHYLYAELTDDERDALSDAVCDNVQSDLTDDAFDEAVSELVENTMQDDYFSSILLNTEDNTISTNEKEPEEYDGQLVNDYGVNIDALAEVQGSFSADLENIDAVDRNGSYVSIDDLSLIGYDADVNEDSILISKPFQTKRLLVHTVSDELECDYGAVQVIGDENGFYVLQYDSEVAASSAYQCLKKDSQVESVCADEVKSVSSYVEDRWGAERVESDRYAEYLAKNNKNSKVVVAVLDTGCDDAHELLKGRTIGGYNAYSNSDNYYDDFVTGHGTHVSGIIADNTPDNVKILPVKIFGSRGTTTSVIVKRGIEFAVKKGADVINMSISGVCTEGDECENNKAVEYAISSGVICVCASGNDNANADKYCPASVKNCITVGAVNAEDKVSFSNYGNCVDIVAPGEAICSSIPGNKYAAYTGSSMAAPFVSAAVAMLKTNDSALSQTGAKTQLKKASIDLYEKGWDKYSGYGVLDFGKLLGDSKAATAITSTPSITMYTSNYLNMPSFDYEYNIEPADATDKSYSVKISDSSVLSMDKTTVYAKKNGNATITFALTNGNSTCKTNVSIKKADLWIDYADTKYAGGNGTQSSPYLISTAKQLAKVAQDYAQHKLNGDTYFKQTKNINLAGKQWYPIDGCNKDSEITRVHFDGNGYTISDLTITNKNYANTIIRCGLFSECKGELKNINLVNVNIDMPENTSAAGICSSFSGVCHDCTVSGKLSAGSVGGICSELCNGGEHNTTKVYNCSTDIEYKSNSGGGIVDLMTAGIVHNCYANVQSGSVISAFGGIVGSLTTLPDDSNGRFLAYGSQVYNCVANLPIFAEKKQVLYGKTTAKPIASNCYYYDDGNLNYAYTNTDDCSDTTKTVKKVDASVLKTKAFYTNSSNWSSAYPWNVKSIWSVNNSLPLHNKTTSKARSGKYEYIDLGDSIMLTGYNGTSTTLSMPNTIEGKPVKFIDSIFNARSVKPKKINFPENLEQINSYAFFRFEKLGTLNFSNNVKRIYLGAFYACSELTCVILPEKLELLDSYVFSDIPSLERVYFTGKKFSNINRYFCHNKDVVVYYPSDRSGWDTSNVSGHSTKKYNPKKVTAVMFPGEDNICLSILIGQPKTLDPIVVAPRASDKNLTYTSKDKSIVTVDSKGTVKLKKNSNGTITIKSKDGNYTRNYTVHPTGWACIVKFNGNGANSGSMSTQYMKYGKSVSISANQFKKTGYTFAGWSLKKNGSVKYKNKAKVKNITGKAKTITLYAVWKPISYSVSFDANGGTGSMSKQSGFKYDTSTALSKNKFKAPKGKVFAGWSTTKDATPKYTNGQKVKNLTSTSGKTVTLYAYWVEPVSYKISYKLNGGKQAKGAPTTYKRGTGAQLPKPTKKGYKFAGWYTDSKLQSGKTTSIKPWASGNKVYYAKWVKS